MLLILTNSEDATASYLSPILYEAGISLLRLDTDRIIERCKVAYSGNSITLKVDGGTYSPVEITNVWYRRPEKLKSPNFNDSPESRYALAEWTEALEAFFAHVPQQKWVNHPSCNAAASRKLQQLTTAASVGFTIPASLVTQDGRALREFFQVHKGRVIVKPMASGYIERDGERSDSLIYTNRLSERDLQALDELVHCPTLFQELVPKTLDVRITVVDDELHAVSLSAKDGDGSQRCDIRRNNMSDVSYDSIEVPKPVRDQIQRLKKLYELRFAAIDMAVSEDGHWYFLEINPNGQWAWLDMAAKQNIAASFVRSFSSKIAPPV